MLREPAGLAVVVATLLGAASAGAATMAPACHPRSVNVERGNNTAALRFDAAGRSLCMHGSPAALQLEVHQVTIATVLAALSTVYKISYRSSITLDEPRNGAYVGSLGHVISRLLRGYDYVVKQENANVDVVIFDKSKPTFGLVDRKGGQAVAAPIVHEVSRNFERPAAHTARTR